MRKRMLGWDIETAFPESGRFERDLDRIPQLRGRGKVQRCARDNHDKGLRFCVVGGQCIIGRIQTEVFETLIQAILFDFDYTLADSSQGVIDCIGYALRELDLLPVPDESACRTIGLSLPDTLVTLVGPQPANVITAFARLFVEQADRVMADKTALFSGVRETVAWLQGQGIVLGIVSTKYRRRIETILRREGLLAPFAVVVGGEDVRAHKPDPSSLRTALELLDVSPGQALYVGDSVTDAEAARRAEVPFVAVLSGTTPREAFGEYPIYAVIEDLKGLARLIESEGGFQ
jgi:phosphoglycolate phosphatase